MGTILTESKLFLSINYIFSRLCLATKYFGLGVVSCVISSLLFIGLFSNESVEKRHLFNLLSHLVISKKSAPILTEIDVNKLNSFKDTDWKESFPINEPTYNFAFVGKAFYKIDVSRISELSKTEFEELILSSVPIFLRDKLKPFLKTTLLYSEKFQVDPFWVLAVMWTESHFNPKAKSYVNARGLMQIMPRTGYFLAELLEKPVKNLKSAIKITKKPVPNIEMGAFYLKKILGEFNGNYIYATAAYNMGPGGVKKRLRKGLRVGNRNKYVNKVKRAYRELIKGYRKSFISLPRDYVETFVFKNKDFSRLETSFLWDRGFWRSTHLPYKRNHDKGVFLAVLLNNDKETLFL
ncbi:MAG: hypothetical protein CME68_09620 [Halobacteriovoraceae bacterium]|nr:hypothetical protein [Halobacteriovoraceae bacterium]|tara:strand:- start:1545 stop:2597 length:1053 start_codon:yes stop_codon:yes gene_type:complete